MTRRIDVESGDGQALPFPYVLEPTKYCPACGKQGEVWEEGVISDELLAYCLACDTKLQMYVFPKGVYPADDQLVTDEIAKIRRAIGQPA